MSGDETDQKRADRSAAFKRAFPGDRPGTACSDINVLSYIIPCKGCTCGLRATVVEGLLDRIVELEKQL